MNGTAAPPSTNTTPAQPQLPAHILAMIRGGPEAAGTEQDKEAAYNSSLSRWWHEYASRKNDEEEEHVADSLLYDERCHLPRTTGPPVGINQPQTNGTATTQANGTQSHSSDGILPHGIQAANHQYPESHALEPANGQ